MSLIPSDVVTDQDLLAIDVQASEDFGSSPLAEKRRVAVTQWLRPRLEAQGLPPAKHKTTRSPEAAWSYTASAYADRAQALGIYTDADVNLAAILATPGSDALYVGMQQPFRGLFVALGDTVNANSLSASVGYWNGRWATPNSLADTTKANSLVSFSGTGRLTWALPDDWTPRVLNNSLAYWVKLTVPSALTATQVSQLLPIAFSRLTAPCAYQALAMLYTEAIGTNRGGETYEKKAEMFLKAAQRELELAMPFVGDEFDVDNSNAVDPTEVQSLVVNTDLTTWERG